MSGVLEDVVVSVLGILKLDHEGIFEAILDAPDQISHETEPKASSLACGGL